MKISTFSKLSKEKKEFYKSSNGMKFPKNTISIFVSQSGIGKSFSILKYLMELSTKGIKSIYLATEDDESEIYSRIEKILSETEWDVKNIEENLFIVNEIEELTYKNKDTFSFNENGDKIIEFIKKNNIDIIVIDTLDYVSNFDENNNNEATEFIKLYKKKFIIELKKTLIFVHHLGKIKNKELSETNIDDIRGASSIVGKVRYVLFLFNKEKKLFLKILKSNISESREVVELKGGLFSNKIMF